MVGTRSWCSLRTGLFTDLVARPWLVLYIVVDFVLLECGYFFCRLLDTGGVICVSYGVRIGWPLLLIRAFNATVVTQSHANAKNENGAV